MIKINFDNEIKTVSDYKVGDVLVMIVGPSIIDDCAYLVTGIAINGEQKFTLVPINELNLSSAEEVFDSLDDMAVWYEENHVRFAKVDMEANFKLSE